MLSSFAHDAEHVVEMDDVPPRGAYALPPPPAVPRGALERMEAQLREAIFTRSTSIASEQRVLRAAFRAIDLDGSGNIDFGEFQAALERFGLHVAASGLKGVGGISQDIAKAFFDRFDTDGSGFISLQEFSTRLLDAPDRPQFRRL